MIELNKIYNEDCMETMARMDDESIDCCITSPPYWGLRDYGVDGQLGLEKRPEGYVVNMVDVFAEVRRVLKKDGTLWLNLGDSYATQSGAYGGDDKYKGIQKNIKGNSFKQRKPQQIGLKQKDLVGIPWRVAFALQADGWYLRSDIIWSKPNSMPESVKDRPTKAHEYIFLMSKSAKYYYDANAIRDNQDIDSLLRLKRGWNGDGDRGYPNGPQNHIKNYMGKPDNEIEDLKGANKRSVWTVNTHSYKEAHFATYPEKLIEPCVLAGCPKDGVIYDPFGGAGTTALVALRAERQFILSEISSEYCDIAEKRITPLKDQYKLNLTLGF